jgi:hypothetical protein
MVGAIEGARSGEGSTAEDVGMASGFEAGLMALGDPFGEGDGWSPFFEKSQRAALTRATVERAATMAITARLFGFVSPALSLDHSAPCAFSRKRSDFTVLLAAPVGTMAARASAISFAD